MWRTFTVLGVVVLLTVVPFGYAGVDVDGSANRLQTDSIESCTTITEPGRYVLAANITDSSEDACIRIETSDVVLDGRGHTIDGVQNRSRLEAFANASYGIVPDETGETTQQGTTAGPDETTEATPGTTEATPGPTDGAANASDAAENRTVNVSFPTPSNPEWANTGIAANASTPLTNVTVTDVTVREFVFGIYYHDVSDGAMRNVRVTGNGDGLEIHRSNQVAVTESALDGNQWGLYAENSSALRVDRTTARENDESGIYVFNSTSVRVSSSTVERSGASGIVLDGVNDSRVVDSASRANEFDGIFVIAGERNRITDNEVTGNGHAGISLILGSTNNSLVGNVVANTTGTDEFTAMAGYSAGIVLNNSSRNLVADTLAANNTNWTYYSWDGSSDNTVRNLTTGGASVSFVGTDVALARTDERLGDAAAANRTGVAATNRPTTGAGFVVANTSADASLREMRIDWRPGGRTDERGAERTELPEPTSAEPTGESEATVSEENETATVTGDETTAATENETAG